MQNDGLQTTELEQLRNQNRELKRCLQPFWIKFSEHFQRQYNGAYPVTDDTVVIELTQIVGPFYERGPDGVQRLPKDARSHIEHYRITAGEIRKAMQK